MVRARKILMMAMMPIFLLAAPFTATVFAEAPAVFDKAGLLMEDEKIQLEESALALGEELGLDLVFVTTNDVEGMDSADYAGEFYDRESRGYDGTYDGILYLLNMEDREVYIYTLDGGRDYLPDEEIDYMLDQVYTYLGEEDYSGSMFAFLEELDAMQYDDSSGNGAAADGSSPGGNYNGSRDSGNGGLSAFEEFGIYLLAALAVGGITVGVMAMNNKGRPTVNEDTYLVGNSFKVTKKIDRHYNTIVTQQHIPKNTSGGGGSGSGGSGAGGGGRSF